MEDEVNLVGLALRRREKTLDAFHEAVRGFFRRGRNLVDGHRAGVEVGENEVGKRAADIDANHLHELRTPSVKIITFASPQAMPGALSARHRSATNYKSTTRQSAPFQPHLAKDLPSRMGRCKFAQCGGF